MLKLALFLLVVSAFGRDSCSGAPRRKKCVLSKADMVLRLGDTWSRIRPQSDLDDFMHPDVTLYQSVVEGLTGLNDFKALQRKWHEVMDPMTCMMQMVGDGPEANQATAKWRCRGKFVKTFENLRGKKGVTLVDQGDIPPHNEYVYFSGYYTLNLDEDGWLKHLVATWDTGTLLEKLRDPKVARARDPLIPKDEV